MGARCHLRLRVFEELKNNNYRIVNFDKFVSFSTTSTVGISPFTASSGVLIQ